MHHLRAFTFQVHDSGEVTDVICNPNANQVERQVAESTLGLPTRPSLPCPNAGDCPILQKCCHPEARKGPNQNYVLLAKKGFSCAPQRQEFACANVLLDSIETRNFVQATLF